MSMVSVCAPQKAKFLLFLLLRGSSFQTRRTLLAKIYANFCNKFAQLKYFKLILAEKYVFKKKKLKKNF
jgi:hypothetical protein